MRIVCYVMMLIIFLLSVSPVKYSDNGNYLIPPIFLLIDSSLIFI